MIKVTPSQTKALIRLLKAGATKPGAKAIIMVTQKSESSGEIYYRTAASLEGFGYAVIEHSDVMSIPTFAYLTEAGINRATELKTLKERRRSL